MIHKVRCERLAPDKKAIQQANILLKDLILFKKSVLLFIQINHLESKICKRYNSNYLKILDV